MYKIIGTDQKEYGPVSGDQLRQWIAEGRINARTMVQPEGGQDWKPLADFPEFQLLLSQRPQPISPASPAGAAPKTSGLAITSLILGVLGVITCGITAIIGLILGIVSMRKIQNSGGRLGGWGVALAGTIVSGIFLIMIPIGAAMLLPALMAAKQRAQTVVCVNNARQLAFAVRAYSSNNKDQFPPAATWCDAIQSSVPLEKIFRCPSAGTDQKCHYAFNAKLGGMDVNKVAPDTVMIFETAGGWDVNGGSELLLDQSRHRRGIVVAFADGRVQVMNESRLGTLRWDP
jgi:hypothetical protein